MIYELFSRRKRKAERSGSDDVYQYTFVPRELRIQIQQILVDAIGPQFEPELYSVGSRAHNPHVWDEVHKVLCRELGVHRLGGDYYSLPIEGVLNHIGTADVDGFLDAVEVCCRVIELVITPLGEYQRTERGIKQEPAAALREVNYRFREAGLGFQYQNGQIFRSDSEYIHDEVVKPALRLLSDPHFVGAQEEFLQAHQHFRAGENEQAIVWAAKAFESALKGICEYREWTYEKGARASDLLKLVRSKGLWPDYLDGSFDQLLATLTSGLPKVRNDAGAHGQGPIPRKVPTYIAAYALNLCATKMLLLAEATKDR